mgnify:CR=1 FL=1
MDLERRADYDWGVLLEGEVDPDPVVLAQLARERVARGQDLPPAPLYLRRPDVMPPAARKRALA